MCGLPCATLVDALFHGLLPPVYGPTPFGVACGEDDACGKAIVQGVITKRGCAWVFRGESCASRKSFRYPCAQATVGEPALPRRDEAEMCAEAARGNAAMEFAVRRCASVRWGHELVEVLSGLV